MTLSKDGNESVLAPCQLTDVSVDRSSWIMVTAALDLYFVAASRQSNRKQTEMANIDWHIIGHITAEGKIRISGFSFGGDKLFDSPIDLDEMIDALAASHEMPPDMLLSAAGRKELTQLGATLSKAGSEVGERLSDDETKSAEVQSRDSDDEYEPN